MQAACYFRTLQIQIWPLASLSRETVAVLDMIEIGIQDRPVCCLSCSQYKPAAAAHNLSEVRRSPTNGCNGSSNPHPQEQSACGDGCTLLPFTEDCRVSLALSQGALTVVGIQG